VAKLAIIQPAHTSQQRLKSSTESMPINKGHFDMDTPERVASFHSRLAHGWPQEEYKAYRSAWISEPQQKNIRDYPILVDIEMASSCNLRCPMCYTTTEHFKKNVKRKVMKYDLFKKIIDEVAGKVYAVRLSLRGEPTLHKKFVEAVAYAKESGIREVSFLTNGWCLDLDYFKRLVDAGADWITVSFDGVHETYNEIRKPLKYKDTVANLKAIADYKRENGITKPVVKVQGIWPAIQNDVVEYYDTLAPITDLVAYNPLIDYLDNDTDLVYEDRFSCPQLYQRLVITSTGEAVMCSNDEHSKAIVGDVNHDTVHSIWHGDAMNSIREQHRKENGFLENSICRSCYYPRQTEPGELVQIGQRQFQIENYVNRSQKVGT
jgi:radical SAM protein with 4Fe4S-binding SPASM domain